MFIQMWCVHVCVCMCVCVCVCWGGDEEQQKLTLQRFWYKVM